MIKFKKTLVSICVINSIIFIWSNCFGEILFQDNFNSYNSNWTVTQPDAPTAANAYSGESSILNKSFNQNKYHSYYIAGSYYVNNGMNSIILNNINNRAVNSESSINDRALTFWNESDNRGDGWASDNQIGISLPQGHDELYVRFYIKFQPNWQWKTDGESDQKIVRISHYHGGSPFKYFSGGNQHPLANINIAKFSSTYNNANVCIKADYRYENIYFPDQATPNHKRSEVFYPPNANYSGTGVDLTKNTNWQCWDIRVKMNSSPGVADGIFQFWIDGKRIFSVTDLAWSDNGSQLSPRLNWNYVIIGGNNFNHFAPNTQEAEQWYAVDDLVISTTPICGLPKKTVGVSVK